MFTTGTDAPLQTAEVMRHVPGPVLLVSVGIVSVAVYAPDGAPSEVAKTTGVPGVVVTAVTSCSTPGPAMVKGKLPTPPIVCFPVAP
ncbi:hypothetical protein ELQ90_03155 [Labedella phragmitis]|uniref:Uncharacterized protein n=1 Tax=Labedella phragmitis TaxID=2498849 RepID=A0A3S3ZD82_9MICO|nr:hypothetical protein ELQ90_03155 [Labedella phragmitis]